MSLQLIRPHHGLCSLFFEGKGYNENFVRNYSNILHLLNKDTVIKLHTDTDIICRCCPENLNGICMSAEKVFDYDTKVLELCGLENECIIKWYDFQSLVIQNILEKNKLSFICQKCCWYDICYNKSLKYYTNNKKPVI